MKLSRYLLFILSLILLNIASANNKIDFESIEKQAPTLNPKVLKLAIQAYNTAHYTKGLDKQEILTIVDFSLPSTKKRFWVLDLKKNKVLYNTWVAQAKNTGEIYAKHFSNNVNSLESSIGVYLTGKAYYGNLGYSMRIHGLSKGYNTNVFRRNVVVHGASYVGKNAMREYGHPGYTWGCFALSLNVYKAIINRIHDGTLMFAYYPDKKWLSYSPYIHPEFMTTKSA